jgi:DHA1 family tetracycline resistance protein-like MFS transporter
MGGAGASGFVIGPAIGGLLGDVSVRLPFVASAVLAIGGAALGYFLLRETLPESRRRPFTLARANPMGILLQMSRTPIVLGFLLVIFFSQMAAQSQMSIWAYHTKLVFDWSLREIGFSVAFFGVILALVKGGLTGMVISRIGPARTVLLGFLLSAPTYFLFAFAPSGSFMIAGIVFGGLGGLTFPALQQMMSERVAEDAQGELQGAIASIVSITSIIGPLIMTATFGVFADNTGVYFPGAPYLLAAGFVACSISLAIWNIRRMGFAPAVNPV